MPNPKAQNTIEFGWTGTDGYIRNGGKYNLLTSKPQMTFAYDTVMYSTDPAVEDVRTVGTQVFPLQPNEMSELHDYAVANSVTDPWNPDPVPELPFTESTPNKWDCTAEEMTFKGRVVLTGGIEGLPETETPISKDPNALNFWVDNSLHMEHTGSHLFSGDVEFKGGVTGLPKPVIQTKEIIDRVYLAGTGYTQSHSLLLMTLVSEEDGTPAVLYRLTSYGSYSLPSTADEIKRLNLKVMGVLGNGTQYSFCHRIASSGITTNISATKIYEYRVNFAKRQTNDLQFVLKAERAAVTGLCEFVIEFTLPNMDIGLGVPFPEFPTSKSTTHKVYNVTD